MLYIPLLAVVILLPLSNAGIENITVPPFGSRKQPHINHDLSTKMVRGVIRMSTKLQRTFRFAQEKARVEPLHQDINYIINPWEIYNILLVSMSITSVDTTDQIYEYLGGREIEMSKEEMLLALQEYLYHVNHDFKYDGLSKVFMDNTIFIRGNHTIKEEFLRITGDKFLFTFYNVTNMKDYEVLDHMRHFTIEKSRNMSTDADYINDADFKIALMSNTYIEGRWEHPPNISWEMFYCLTNHTKHKIRMNTQTVWSYYIEEPESFSVILPTKIAGTMGLLIHVPKTFEYHKTYNMNYSLFEDLRKRLLESNPVLIQVTYPLFNMSFSRDIKLDMKLGTVFNLFNVQEAYQNVSDELHMRVKYMHHKCSITLNDELMKLASNTYLTFGQDFIPPEEDYSTLSTPELAEHNSGDSTSEHEYSSNERYISGENISEKSEDLNNPIFLSGKEEFYKQCQCGIFESGKSSKSTTLEEIIYRYYQENRKYPMQRISPSFNNKLSLQQPCECQEKKNLVDRKTGTPEENYTTLPTPDSTEHYLADYISEHGYTSKEKYIATENMLGETKDLNNPISLSGKEEFYKQCQCGIFESGKSSKSTTVEEIIYRYYQENRKYPMQSRISPSFNNKRSLQQPCECQEKKNLVDRKTGTPEENYTTLPTPDSTEHYLADYISEHGYTSKEKYISTENMLGETKDLNNPISLSGKKDFDNQCQCGMFKRRKSTRRAALKEANIFRNRNNRKYSVQRRVSPASNNGHLLRQPCECQGRKKLADRKTRHHPQNSTAKAASAKVTRMFQTPTASTQYTNFHMTSHLESTNESTKPVIKVLIRSSFYYGIIYDKAFYNFGRMLHCSDAQLYKVSN